MAKSSVTADELQVYMEEGNPMGIQSNQHYSLFVGGWEWPCISANIQRYDVGLIVKCSGYHPTADTQKPDPQSSSAAGTTQRKTPRSPT